MSRPRALPGRLAALLAAVLLAAPAGARGAGQPLLLTLEEAVRLGAERSWDVRRAEESRNDLQGYYLEKRSAAFPQLTAVGTLSRGGDGAAGARGLGGDSAGGVSLAVTQPLFTWGRLSAAIRAAGLALDGWREDREIARQAAVRDVTTAFHDLLLARELAGVAAGDLARRTRHLEEARRRQAAGTATDYDVLAAEVAERTARPVLVGAENLVRTARERLRFLVGAGDREVDADGTLATAPAPLPTPEEALAAARAHRPEPARLRRDLGTAEEVVVITAAGDKPTLGLSGVAGWRDQLLGEPAGSGAHWSAGIELTFPLFDGRATAGRVGQARSRAAALRLEQGRLDDALALACRTALNDALDAAGRLEAVEGTLALAERVLSLAERGYELGVKTGIEVADAGQNLSVARAELARARRDLLVARVNLAWVMGGL